ncbi:MAG: sigma-54-dependent Fis family transcriptional regulator [Chitinispirillaceae bacterium]|jgi:Nif-specific regulatory protein|nr:sigma-54-dependent Fis family transcriptional regulator [Chitinispirillaceae bacterium]
MKTDQFPALVAIATSAATPVTGRLFTIGSSPGCRLHLSGKKIPGIAGHLIFRGGTYELQIVSRDVTVMINGKSPILPHSLCHGDRVRFGSDEFIFAEKELESARLPSPMNSEAARVSGGGLTELINNAVMLMRNTNDEMFSDLVASVSRILTSDAARLVEEDAEGGRRTIARYPSSSGLDRFSNRAIDWAKNAGRTVIMHDGEWDMPNESAHSLKKNLIATILCAPLRDSDRIIGYLYLDRLQGNCPFTEEDRGFCDAVLPLFSEILANHNTRLRQKETIARLQEQHIAPAGGILCESDVMKQCLQVALKAARTELPVLVLGETGTGKELLAKYVHASSRRAEKPFRAINCGALPENLIESELFGHEKGAFTGANARKTGLFESADKGTVFLDEIGDMAQHLQVKLLRVLQEGEFTRVGGNDAIRVDVRIIAATNRELGREVNEGRFRQDLFFRLNVMSIELPPLRRRGSDIMLLAEYFLKKYCQQFGLPAKTLSAEARNMIIGHAWPGNIRELENAVQKAILVSAENRIVAGDISLHKGTGAGDDVPGETLRSARETAERACIENALSKTRGNVSLASKQIEIDRKWLIKKMEELGINADRYRKQ